MKKFFMMLMALVWMLPVHAQDDAGDLLGSLLQLGAQVVEELAAPATPTPTDQEAALSVRGFTNALLEGYKQEGREYAREVGDIITQRIMEDKKINETLDSMRIFCWAVVIYLSIVTLIVLYMLLRLRVLYSKISEKLPQR